MVDASDYRMMVAIVVGIVVLIGLGLLALTGNLDALVGMLYQALLYIIAFIVIIIVAVLWFIVPSWMNVEE